MSALPFSLIIRTATAAGRPVRRGARVARTLVTPRTETLVQRWLIAHSVAALRISVGAIFLLFGLLKFAPGVSPAQDLVERTTDILSFGIVPGSVALVLVATLESTIGVLLLCGRRLRIAVGLLTVQLVGILSPLALLPGRLFMGPHGAPTLEGQYVIKDLVLVGAALVLAATLGGARIAEKTHDDITR